MHPRFSVLGAPMAYLEDEITPVLHKKSQSTASPTINEHGELFFPPLNATSESDFSLHSSQSGVTTTALTSDVRYQTSKAHHHQHKTNSATVISSPPAYDSDAPKCHARQHLENKELNCEEKARLYDDVNDYKDEESLFHGQKSRKSRWRCRRSLRARERCTNRSKAVLHSFLLVLLVTAYIAYKFVASRGNPPAPNLTSIETLRDTFSTSQKSLFSRCQGLNNLDDSVWPSRIDSLSNTLYESSPNDVWIAEPGSSALYYSNIGSGNWSLSERPFLIVVQAQTQAHSAAKNTHVTILTPRFELDRAKLLSIPGLNMNHQVTYVDWKEEESPFQVLLDHIGYTLNPGEIDSRRSKIHLDPAVRTFVASGLKNALEARGFVQDDVEVDLASKEVLSLRERKSVHEIEQLRCANELTLEAIQSTKDHMKFGISESETSKILERYMSAFGLDDGGGLVLFGEDAALPHGHGTDKKLDKHDFVLIDAGGSFHGYISDITRTFALPGSQISSSQARIWEMVKNAQLAALDAGFAGQPANRVDAAARATISSQATREEEANGFTHRLGHGIGLEGHESPYLVGSNRDPIVKGNVFSNEPGVYIVDEVGVRLEDCWFVNDDGKGEMFTGPTKSYWEV